MLSSDRYRQGARRFAAKYANFDANRMLAEMVDLLEQMVR